MPKLRRFSESATVQRSIDRPDAQEQNPLKTHLQGKQQAAIEGMMSGKSVPESAKAAGVNKSTVYRWVKSDPKFMAEYNIWHEELEQQARSRLLDILHKATAAIDAALEAGDSRLAMQLLKGMGVVYKAENRLTDADELRSQDKLDAKRRRIKREVAERNLETDRIVADVQYEQFAHDRKEGGEEEA
jgi:AcrR family transcriptional regulator